MSPIGRVFVIINLILSVAFVAFAGNLLQNGESYREKFLKEQAAHEQTRKEKDQVIAKLQADLQSKKSDYTVAHSQVLNLQNQIKMLQQELKDAKDTNAQNVASLTEIKANLDVLKTDVDKAREENKNLLEKEAAAEKAREAAENARLALEEQVASLKNEIAKLNDKIATHEATIAKLENEKENLNAQVAMAVAQGFVPGRPQKDLDALVMAVNKVLDTTLVTLSVGKDDGVAKGYTFDIYRGGSYKARAQVIEVDNKSCVARVVNARLKVAKGDRAKTNL